MFLWKVRQNSYHTEEQVIGSFVVIGGGTV
jgi:hypothetical protein